MGEVVRAARSWWQRVAAREWARLGGAEYTALSLLPAADSTRVWRAAFRRMVFDRRAGVRFALLFLPLVATAPGVAVLAQWFGAGAAGRLAADVVIHALLGLALHHWYMRAMAELNRPFVRAELLAEYG